MVGPTLAKIIDDNKTALNNGISFRTPVFKLMTKIVYPSLFLILLVYIMDLYILVSSLFVNKIIKLVHLYIATGWCVKGKSHKVQRDMNEYDF